MARYEQSYSGERRTAALHVQLTPGQRAQLEAEAAEAGVPSLSEYVRIRCFRRRGRPRKVAGTRHNPDARELAFQLSAIGNNLNQLARIANATRALPGEIAFRATLALVKAALERVIAL